jgi:hypothetical protein
MLFLSPVTLGFKKSFLIEEFGLKNMEKDLMVEQILILIMSTLA